MTRPDPKLAALWARKLAASGFDDIERPNGRLFRAAEETRRRIRQGDADGSAEWAVFLSQAVDRVVWPSRRARVCMVFAAEQMADVAGSRTWTGVSRHLYRQLLRRLIAAAKDLHCAKTAP